MTSVVLLNLRYNVDIEFQSKESLGLCYLGSTLLDRGHDVTVIDAQANNMDVGELSKILKQGRYDIIGVSLYQETMPSLARLLELLGSENRAHVCCGGHYASFEAENLVKNFSRIDSVVIGEGEQTLSELADRLPDRYWRDICGMCYFDGENVVFTAPRRLILDLDSIRLPYRGYDLNRDDVRPDVEATVSASRGCYAHCEFCSIQAFYRFQKGKALRIRNPRKVVHEIEILNRCHNVVNFFFADDNFMITELLQKGWVHEFCIAIREKELNISFDIDCRVDDLDRETFTDLRSAGLRGVFLGIESFVQRQLDLMNKGVTVEDNVKGIQLLRDLRITVWIGFIMFDPFSTLEEIRANVAGLERINYFRYFNYDRPLSCDLLASRLIPYPGTPIVATLQQKCPKLLHRTSYGYDYDFADPRTDRFCSHLRKWKKTSLEMIRMDTTRLIQLALLKRESVAAASLHALSRKYMKLDKKTFLQMLDAIEADHDDTIDDIIGRRKREWLLIRDDIEAQRAELFREESRFSRPEIKERPAVLNNVHS